VKALQIDGYGPLNALQIREVAEPPLAPDEVRIQVEAAGINPSDVGVALGRFPVATLPRILGRDFAGTVIEGRPDLIGIPVWGSGGGELGMTRDGSHAERMVLPARDVIRRPAALSAEEAAVAGVPFVTAWSALVEVAGFKAGEWAIISGAAGAVGTAAVQLVLALNGHVIALVLESDDLSPLQGLNVTAVLRSDRDNVPDAVRELTAGRGADVALNAVGAPIFTPLLESLANDGRMVVFSARAGRDVQLDLFAFYRRRLRLFGLDTVAFDLSQIAGLYKKFGSLFESRAVKPPPIAARFPLAQARAGYQRVDGGAQGKVVLLPGA
jgi:NADPH:quinone reductase-like Zn-dependent oxidoreductase